jgi:23S rRNA (guanosine2251-2'-O)-methyltransferase
MPPVSYQIRQCQRQGCGLRYPVVEGQPFSQHCPRCRGATRLVLERSLSQEAWEAPVTVVGESAEAGEQGVCLEAMLDNLRSAWNVGSIFRSADGAGFRRLHLCGISPTPENPAVGKTALGAEQSLPWEYAADGVEMASQLLEQGCCLWALEQDPRAEPLHEIHSPLPGGRLVLVVGNEVCGVDPGILELCERAVYIPMRGGKRSLNVAVAFGIAAFALGGGLD